MNKRISDIFSYEDEPIFWESCEEIDPETVKTLTLRRIRPRRARRVSRTLLIAAVIVSLLTVSAIAVGLSVQTQRKENLRQMLEIDAKNVDGYTEFPIPSESDSGEAAPSVVLLSAVKDGECETVYVSISPIEEKDMFSGFWGWFLVVLVVGAIFGAGKLPDLRKEAEEKLKLGMAALEKGKEELNKKIAEKTKKDNAAKKTVADENQTGGEEKTDGE